MTKTEKFSDEDLKIISKEFEYTYTRMMDLFQVLCLQDNITKETFNYALDDLSRLLELYDQVTNDIRKD